ncbi:MAG: hypothetical protein IPL26_05395 [Leptospiraceae bacterium]|nr:hypothetical protein [Leptospiraceae bacterium]
MKEPNWKTATEEEVWKYVAYHLAKSGIGSVLVGGSVVSIYSKGIYRSGDLDLVCTSFEVTNKDLIPIMSEIGFKKRVAGRHFEHPKCKHIFVEFLSPPVMIADDFEITPDEIKVKGKIIKILSPTDCIKDRLASFIYFQSRDCLEQAILVAQSQPFHLSKIEQWAKKEGKQAEKGFQEFLKELKNKNLTK